MAKLYFLGGDDIKVRNAKSINKKAFLEAGGHPVVLDFPWTSKEEKIKYRQILIDYFKDIGARNVIFAELFESLNAIEKKIKSADVIYLPGGEPKYLIKRLHQKGVDKLLKDYRGIIIGNSAGSLAMCKKSAVIKGQGGRSKTSFEKGLDFVDFAVSVHYRASKKIHSGESPAKSLRMLSTKNDVRIFAIPENSAVVYDGKEISIIGDVYLFYKGKKTKCTSK